MASNTLSGDLISERYGAALYDLASEKKCIDDILNDFELVQKALKESSELRQVIKSPLVNSDEKLNILLKLFSKANLNNCLLYTSPSPRDQRGSRMPSSA